MKFHSHPYFWKSTLKFELEGYVALTLKENFYLVWAPSGAHVRNLLGLITVVFRAPRALVSWG